jgi:hypothetical protein
MNIHELNKKATSGPLIVIPASGSGLQIGWKGDSISPDREGQVCTMRWTDGMNAATEERVQADAIMLIWKLRPRCITNWQPA